MSRRHRAEKREVNPDAKFGDIVVTKFMNSLMKDGKKSAAEGIVYGAFEMVQQKSKQDPIQVFHTAPLLKNITLMSGAANIQAHMDEVIELIRHGRLDPSVIISHRLPLSEAAKGYELFDQKEALKVVIDPAG